MKPQIFLDTNVLISGIFFSGAESILLKLPNVTFVTSDVNYHEVVEVVKRKFRKLHRKILETALEEVDRALQDIKIITDEEWVKKLAEASKLLIASNDQKILAAVLTSKADYFVTGDRDFHKPKIRESVKVISTRKLLEELGIL